MSGSDSGQPSIGEILKIDDANDFAIAIADFVMALPDEFDEMPAAHKVVYCINELEMEVGYGGFENFFYSFSGGLVPDTLQALDAIGAKKCLKLVQEAVKLFPGGELPQDKEVREACLAALPAGIREAWMALDQKFYEYPDDLASLMRTYVLANQDQFL